MPLTKAQRKFLVVEQAIGAGIGNFLLNAFFVWFTFPGERLLLWGFPGIATDVLGTCFLLPWLTALVIGPFVRKAIRDGKLTPIVDVEPPQFLRWVPAGPWHRSWVVGTATTLAVAPPTIALLMLFGVESAGRADFAIGKGIFAAALAAGVAPLCAYFSLLEAKAAVAPNATPVLE